MEPSLKKLNEDLEKEYDDIYATPGKKWTRMKPPKELKELIDGGIVKPCKAIDIGCGEGHLSIYLASRGFDVLGVDISRKAISYAKENVRKAGVRVRFRPMNANELDMLHERFDFVLAWSFLHCLPEALRKDYAKNIASLINKNGIYFGTSFNCDNLKSGKRGQRERVTKSGHRFLFSSLAEAKSLYSEHFAVISAKRFLFDHEKKDSWGNYLLLRRK